MSLSKEYSRPIKKKRSTIAKCSKMVNGSCILVGKIIPSPDPYKERIELGDILIVVGTRPQINHFLELCGRCST